jgi:hypothetical protein
VDNVLIVYGVTLTNIHTVLNSFNNATSPLQFTIEEEQQQKIRFFILQYIETRTTLHMAFTANPRLRTPSSHRPRVTNWSIITAQFDTYTTD